MNISILRQILEINFSNESLRNNDLAYLTPPQGLYVRVLSLHQGEIVIQAYASVVQPLSVLEVINVLKALPDGYLVMVTTLVRRIPLTTKITAIH